MSVPYQKIYLSLFISALAVSLFISKNDRQEKDSCRVSQKIYQTWKIPALFVSLPRQLKFPEVQPLMSRIPPLGSCFKWVFRFSNIESIHGFTSTFVDICYATSHPFGFTSINKHPLLDILYFLSLH